MPLLRYNPAEGERWVRHLLEPTAIRKTEPRMREGYIRNKLTPVQDRPWQAEISGRLLSLAFDWQLVAIREAHLIGQQHIKFRGVAFVDEADLLADGPPNFCVQPDSICRDWAHANLVAWRAPLAEIDPDAPERPQRISQETARALAKALKLAETNDDFAALETKRRLIDSTTMWSRFIRSILNWGNYGFRLSKRRLLQRIESARA
jgi:hypothetical protein